MLSFRLKKQTSQNVVDTTFIEKDNSAKEKCCKQFPVPQKGDNRKNPVPKSLEEDILEENVCKALSLTGVNVTSEKLLPCHRLKKKQTKLHYI